MYYLLRNNSSKLSDILILAFFFSIFSIFILTEQSEAQQTEIDMDQYKGKVVYLDFWASWCGPCRLSFPFMDRLKGNYSNKDLAVITVNLDNSRSAANNFLKKMNAGLPVIYDPKGEIARTYKVADMPTSVLIDRNGVIRFVHKGFHPDKEAEYISHVSQLIQE